MVVHACRYVVLALREISIAHRCAARSVYASVTTRQRHVHVHVTSLIKGIHVIDDFVDLFIIFKPTHPQPVIIMDECFMRLQLLVYIFVPSCRGWSGRPTWAYGLAEYVCMLSHVCSSYAMMIYDLVDTMRY